MKSRTKSKEGATGGWFAKFPKDIVLCEELTGGDTKILEKEPFAEPTKADRPNYKELFPSSDTPKKSTPKGKGGGASPAAAAAASSGGGAGNGNCQRLPPQRRKVHPTRGPSYIPGNFKKDKYKFRIFLWLNKGELNVLIYTSKTHRRRRSLWDSKPSPQNSLSFEPTETL